jgi:hypothetical protein
MQTERKLTDVYRDFGKLMDELVERKADFGDIFESLQRQARIPEDVAFRIAQAVTRRTMPLPDYSYLERDEKPLSKPKRKLVGRIQQWIQG